MNKEWVRDIGLFGEIVSTVTVRTAVGVGIGYLGWKKLGTPVWLIAVTGIAGFVSAMIQVYRISRRSQNPPPDGLQK